MISPNKLIILFVFSISWPLLYGQDTNFRPAENPEFLASRISEANSKITSLQCDFSQEKDLSFLEEKVYSSGKFYFQKEDKVCWDYEKPYKYVIILNGPSVKIQDEDEVSHVDASASRLFGSINSVISGIMDGTVIKKTDLFKSLFYEDENTLLVSLLPVMAGMKEFIKTIELEINKNDYTVDSLKIIEKSGDYTLISFSNKKFNAAVPENLFDVN